MSTVDGVRARFAAWLLLVAAVGALFLGVVQPRLTVESDILALLPRSERDPAAEAAVRQFSAQLGRRLVFLVGAAEPDSARRGAVALAEVLRATPTFAAVELEAGVATTPEGLAYRHGLLADADRARIATGAAPQMAREALRALYAPAGPPRPLPVAQDPLNLAGGWLLQQLPALPNARLRDGVPMIEDGALTWVPVRVLTAGEAFSVAAQDEVRGAIAAARAAAEASGARVLGSGVMLHAVAAGERARAEMQLFGTVSTIGVVLLIWLAFRSLWPLALSLAVLAFGALAGLSACVLVFGSVHLLTLVFGTSLIGVAVDYSLHFFADQYRAGDAAWNGRAGLAHVGRPILVGHLCAVLGYLALLAAPFPGLRQMALFSAVGLVAACGSVLCLYPVLARAGVRREPALLRLARRLAVPGRLRRPWIVAGATLLLSVAAGGLARLQWLDDVRLLQASPAELLAEEAQVRRLLGQGSESRFVLVRGADAQQVLEREEALRARLEAARADGSLQGYTALSRSLPSLARQRETRALLLREVYAPDGPAGRLLAQLGFAPEIAARLRAELEAAPLLTPEAGLALASTAPLRGLWLEGATPATAVMLQGIGDAAALRRAIEDLPGVRLVDKLGETSQTLQRSRRLAMGLSAAAYALIGLLLAWRYGLKAAPLLLLPPLGGAALTLALLGLFGVPANFFNLLALLLVLGMGVDYAVFLREGRADAAPVLLAILLSTASTLLSFGLLAGSATPFIRSVGLTLALGIGLVFLLAVALHRAGVLQERPA